MKIEELISIASEFLETSPNNYKKKGDAISEKSIGIKIFAQNL
ncbi:MAG: hypothetical protein SCJ93_00855 [Bacillota bacterium]|nr:hypothetical protein [Bacillota bacterium]